MKIDKERLYGLYMGWVGSVLEKSNWRTSFSPQEIVYAIAKIIEDNPYLIENEIIPTLVNDINIIVDNVPVKKTSKKVVKKVPVKKTSKKVVKKVPVKKKTKK